MRIGFGFGFVVVARATNRKTEKAKTGEKHSTRFTSWSPRFTPWQETSTRIQEHVESRQCPSLLPILFHTAISKIEYTDDSTEWQCRSQTAKTNECDATSTFSSAPPTMDMPSFPLSNSVGQFHGSYRPNDWQCSETFFVQFPRSCFAIH